MSVKTFILSSASVAALAFASSASAADIAHHHMSSTRVSIHRPAAFSWEGLYAGVQLGHESNEIKATKANGNTSKDDYQKDIDKSWAKPSGVNGGIYAGYNVDLGNNLVAGVDGNVDLSKVKSSQKLTATNPASEHYNEIKEKYNGAIRARLGYNLGRVLPYVAGGFSFADAAVSENLAKSDGEFNIGKKDHYTPQKIKYKVESGWNLGGGVDYAMSDNLILRADYRYRVINDPTVSTQVHGNDADKTDSVDTKTYKNVDVKSNSFRVGVAYKF